MPRKSLSAPLWPLVYGLGIVAFSFLTGTKSGDSHFSYLYGGRRGHDYNMNLSLNSHVNALFVLTKKWVSV